MPAIHTLSLDIFDTLLLRRLPPEHFRFRHLAERISRALRTEGLERPAGEVFQARLLAAQIAYRTTPETDGDSEGRHSRIIALQLRALDLPEAFAATFVAIETAYETSVVSPNARAVELAQHARRLGKRVILVSDMYLLTPTISAIVEAHGLRCLADAIYVSSEIGLTKQHGGLYHHIVEHEQRPSEGYLHVGDNFRADVLSARRLGWIAAWRPRPFVWRAINYGWNSAYRLHAAIT